MPFSKPIEWSKPNLRLGYLIEGVYALHNASSMFDRVTVRWCGPKNRVGSGVGAIREAWEGRLSGCVYDQTLGTLKQNIQAVSDVTVRVDIGDEDINPSSVIDSSKYLGDAAIYGRWKGHRASLSLVDLDDKEAGEVVGEGTWDRNPTGLQASSFRMTITIGEAIPPNMNWPMGQIPQDTSYFQTASYSSSVAPAPFSPTGVASPDFGISDDLKGKWVGQIFGGDSQLFLNSSHGQTEGHLWREIVVYGALSGVHFAWISPRYDQFCFDVAYEKTDGSIQYVSQDSGSVITVFNNNDPRLGPTGTCVKFSTASYAPWSRRLRAWGNLAGGPIGHFNRPSGYSEISSSGAGTLASPYTGNPSIGSSVGASNKQAEPLAPTGTSLISFASIWEVFQDIITNFIGGELHPDAISILYNYYTVTFPGNRRWYVSACVPLEIVSTPPSMREVMSDFMTMIPGDLVLRRDMTIPYRPRKWMAVPRPIGGESPERVIREGDLYDTNPARNVDQIDDPDGNYSNETTLETAAYWAAPNEDTDKIDNSMTDGVQMINLIEQSPAGINQVITDSVQTKHWKFAYSPEANTAMDEWAALVEREKSRPQKTIEAVHGHPSMQIELAQLISYDIRGVNTGVGQVRGLLLDLDSQTVKVTTYHEPPSSERIKDGVETERSKERLEASNEVRGHRGNVD